jgi:hypothetical protein
VSISGYFSKSAHLSHTANVRVNGEWMTEKEYRARYRDLCETANSEITERTEMMYLTQNRKMGHNSSWPRIRESEKA